MGFHARMDPIGRVTFFDGNRDLDERARALDRA